MVDEGDPVDEDWEEKDGGREEGLYSLRGPTPHHLDKHAESDAGDGEELPPPAHLVKEPGGHAQPALPLSVIVIEHRVESENSGSGI